VSSSAEHWVFDLDGTLVDGISATRLRPGAEELLDRLAAAGCRLSLWSAGGAEYADRIATRVGIRSRFAAVAAKAVDVDGRWALPAGWAAVPVTCVDDEPGRLPPGVRTVALRAWLGGADDALRSVQVGDRPAGTWR
jgi:hypothetical protein